MLYQQFLINKPPIRIVIKIAANLICKVDRLLFLIAGSTFMIDSKID